MIVFHDNMNRIIRPRLFSSNRKIIDVCAYIYYAYWTEGRLELRAGRSTDHVLVFGSEWMGEAAGLHLFLSDVDKSGKRQVRKKTRV